MDFIPEALLLDIFIYLEISEILPKISRVCKTFNRIIYSNAFLDLLTKVKLHLSYGDRILKDTCIQILKSSLSSRDLDFLEFLPCSTNGGADEDRESCWFGHVFEYNEKPWCTQENIYNSNASAVLANTQEEKIGYHWANKQAVKIVKEWLERKGKRLYKKNEHIAVAIFNHVITSFPIDAVCIDEPDPAEMKEKIKTICMNLKPFSNGIIRSRRDPDNPNVQDMDFDRQTADNSVVIATIYEIYVSRKGVYTCPVKTLIVFTSFVYIDILDPGLKVYDNTKSYNNLIELNEVYEGIPMPRGLVVKNGYEYTEFRATSQPLKPVLWLNFLETNRVEEVCIKLNDIVTGKYLYVKLIHPEDRRVERNWNHESMNIDCRYVITKGKVFSLI